MRKRKRLLIDLSILKNLNCGLGQIALNYGKFFAETYNAEQANYDLYLLVPKSMEGQFGNEVKYITINWWRKHFLSLIPKMDVWHSIHQLSHYKPVNKKTKVLLTIHDLNFIYEKGEVKRKKMQVKIQAKFDRADIVTTISNFSKSDIEKHLVTNGKKIQVIFNGVEDLTHSKESKPAFIKNTKPFFFTIGQIKKKKNFIVLLPLMRYYPEFELYIAGQDDTAYANEIRDAIFNGNYENVHLVGAITAEERVWMYRNCSAFLFPSLFEGFGLPIIEAMSFGKPVFSSIETSLKEIGGTRAFFLPTFDAEEMKSIINHHLPKFQNDPSESKQNESYAKQFSYSQHMQAYQSLYYQLLEIN